jgi:hypothetical protein
VQCLGLRVQREPSNPELAELLKQEGSSLVQGSSSLDFCQKRGSAA